MILSKFVTVATVLREYPSCQAQGPLSTSGVGVTLNMFQIEKIHTQVLRAFLAFGLLFAFIRTSAKPSIENFLSEKVVTDETEINKGVLQSPAMTICPEIVGIL